MNVNFRRTGRDRVSYQGAEQGMRITVTTRGVRTDPETGEERPDQQVTNVGHIGPTGRPPDIWQPDPSLEEFVNRIRTDPPDKRTGWRSPIHAVQHIEEMMARYRQRTRT